MQCACLCVNRERGTNMCLCVFTHVGRVTVLAGAGSASGGDANVLSFQQRVDHVVQKGHLYHARVHVLRF